MSNGNELARIRELTSTIGGGYQSAAVQFQRAKVGLESLLTHRLPPADLVDDAKEDVRQYRHLCESYRVMLVELHDLVLAHLPDTYVKLRILPTVWRWHESQDFSWNTADAELIKIRAAAARARTDERAATKPKTKRGTKASKSRKIDVAITIKTREPELSDADVARKAKCDPAYLSRSKEYRNNAALAERAIGRVRRKDEYDRKTGTIHPIDDHDFEQEVDDRIDAEN